MKNNKLPTLPLWISLGVLIIIAIPYIDKHPGLFQFLANLVLVVVTGIYVWLTHEMLKTQKKEMEYKEQYFVIPIFKEIKNSRVLIEIKNASMFSATEVTGYVLMKTPKRKEYKIALTEELALSPSEYRKVMTGYFANFKDIEKIINFIPQDLVKHILIEMEIEKPKEKFLEIVIFLMYRKLNGEYELVKRAVYISEDFPQIVFNGKIMRVQLNDNLLS